MSSHRYVCLYGHFYQPPREDPFTGRIPHEPGATPFDNFNEKITAECYQPNAEEGNFEHISFDLGPTLATWLEQAHPDVYARIIAADRKNVEAIGTGNALAQAYNHTILPLATSRDRATQVAWGIADFEHRYGHKPEGMWLPETAVDMDTLEILVDHGIQYTVLAPWQAAEPCDPTEPYAVHLPSGRQIAVFFYNAPLSGGVSFDWNTTTNADTFAASFLPNHLNQEKAARGEDQLIVIATDGELYGHHKPWRDRFLAHLVNEGAASFGFEVVTLGQYLKTHHPKREVRLRVPSAWSCAHGVNRWQAGCECTGGDPSWKLWLRASLDNLALRLDALFEQESRDILRDPWAARNDYLALRNGWTSPDQFWSANAIEGHAPASKASESRILRLLEAEYWGQCMFTSCGFFFEDLDRIEPRNDIAFARRAISLAWQATRQDLESAFLADLAATRSWRTGLTGVDLYRQLPPLTAGLLPEGSAESAA